MRWVGHSWYSVSTHVAIRPGTVVGPSGGGAESGSAQCRGWHREVQYSVSAFWQFGNAQQSPYTSAVTAPQSASHACRVGREMPQG